MNIEEEFDKRRNEMSDIELINLNKKQLSNLCKTGGKSFTMTVPPRIDDSDMIYQKLIERYETLVNDLKLINSQS